MAKALTLICTAKNQLGIGSTTTPKFRREPTGRLSDVRSKHQASITPTWLPGFFIIHPQLGLRLRISWNYVTMAKLSAYCPSSKLLLQPPHKRPIRSKSYVRQFVYVYILLFLPACLTWCVISDSLHTFRWLRACLSNLKMEKQPTLSKK